MAKEMILKELPLEELVEYAGSLGMALQEKKIEILVTDIIKVLERALKDYSAPFLTTKYIDEHSEFQYFHSWCDTFITQEYVDYILDL